MTKRRTTASLAAAALAIALTGCGGDDSSGGNSSGGNSSGGNDGNGVADLSANEILAKAKDAAADAESFQMSGEIADDDGEFGIDMGFSADGAAGTITFEGETVELVSVKNSYFMKGDKSFWNETTGDPASGKMLGGKYVKVPPEEDSVADMVSFLDRSEFIDDMLTPVGEISKGETSEINGVAVIALVDDSGSALYVATSGDPYPIRIQGSEDEADRIDFVMDEPVEVPVPSDDEIVDLTAMN